MVKARVNDSTRPQVGVGFMIMKDGLVLMGQRKSSHGQGEFGPPGGHLEGLETFEECVLRELREEAGDDIKVKNIRFLCVSNMTKYAPKHYVDIGMIAEWESGEPIVTEPHKLESWQWHPIDNLPQPLFGCVANYVQAYKGNQTYFPKT